MRESSASFERPRPRRAAVTDVLMVAARTIKARAVEAALNAGAITGFRGATTLTAPRPVTGPGPDAAAEPLMVRANVILARIPGPSPAP